MSRDNKQRKKKDNGEPKTQDDLMESGDKSSATGDFSSENITDIMKHLMMQEQRRSERELKREKEKEERDREWALKLEEREEQRRRDDTAREEQRKKDEFDREEKRELRQEKERKEREEVEAARRCADKEWRVTVGLKERETTVAQQQEMRLANTEIHKHLAQKQSYAALMARLPKFEGKRMPTAFIQSLEKQLKDNAIPEGIWLQALEACLQGKASASYWTLVEERDRQDYESAKCAVLRCLGPPTPNKLDQVFNSRWPKEETIAEAWEECVQHVRSFGKEGETVDELAFKWVMVRMLGKCKRECAEAVWKVQPKSVPEAVAAMRDWEHKHGFPAKVWTKRFDAPQERKIDASSWSAPRTESTPAAAEGGARVKVEKPWSQQRYGGTSRTDFKCYKCGEPGHMRRDCPKTTVKRVDVHSEEEDVDVLLMEGTINGVKALCEISTGAQMCVIPESLAGGLPVTGKTICKPVGSSFKADSVKVRVQVGCIDMEVSAAVVPDSFLAHPLVGRNVGVDLLLQCGNMAVEQRKKDTSAEAHAVQTRAMTAKEEKEERQAEVIRNVEKAVIRKPEELEQVNTLTVPDAVKVDNPPQESNSEPLAVVNENVDPKVNVGLVIPSMELGASLGAEYKGAMEGVEMLREWKGYGKDRSKGFLWENGVLKRVVEDELSGSRELVVIPVGLRQRMLGLVHDYLGHVGSGKMAWMLKQSCCWPGLSGDAKRYGKACTECQRMRKGGLAEVPMGEMPIHKTPFEHVAVDIVGPFPRSHGYKYILTYTCLASRYPEAIPLRQATAQECAEALLEIFSRNGVPITLLSDQGAQFMGVLMKRLCERLGIRQIRTTPYHPQSNGAVERMHGDAGPDAEKVGRERSSLGLSA